jgi:hypothetical protein
MSSLISSLPGAAGDGDWAGVVEVPGDDDKVDVSTIRWYDSRLV